MVNTADTFAGLAGGSAALEIRPLDLHGSVGTNGAPIASSVDSEATFSDALLGSSAPSPSTVLPAHPAQVAFRLSSAVDPSACP